MTEGDRRRKKKKKEKKSTKMWSAKGFGSWAQTTRKREREGWGWLLPGDRADKPPPLSLCERDQIV